MNADVLVTLLLGLLDRAAVIGGLLTKAKVEGRDVTTAELDALFAADDVAKATLQAAINKTTAATVKPLGGGGHAEE